MKKALNITIAGTLFTIEEDAYQKLDAYLQSIQSYFGSDPDKLEIVKDIETRIAEQLMERSGSNGIVTLSVIEETIRVMGQVNDFDGPLEDSAGAGASSYRATRKLYRDPDDQVIAGVCSGLGAYFGIDPVFVRLLFVVLVLLGFGAGIVIYIVLALVMPKADTPAEKLQMKGGPVTLSSFKQSVNEQIANARKAESGFFNLFDKLTKILRKIILPIFTFVRVLAGTLLLGVALFISIGSTFGLVNFLFNDVTPFIDFPIAEVTSVPVYNSLVLLAYVLIIVPAIFIGVAGLSCLKKKKSINGTWALGLIGVWILALTVLGSMIVRHGPVIQERIKTLPEYQQVTRTGEFEAFGAIELHGMTNVLLVEGDEVSVSETGTAADLARTGLEVQNGKLVATQTDEDVRSCIFCFGHEPALITITTPGLSLIELHDASRVNAKDFGFDSLKVSASDVSRVNLSGTATRLEIFAEDVARVNASELVAIDVTVETSDLARVQVSAEKTLNVTAADISKVTYSGSPTLTENISDMADVMTRAERYGY